MKGDPYKSRGTLLIILAGAVFVLFGIRLYHVQILSEQYAGKSNMVRKERVIQPPRGNIYDRHGHIYVSNSPLFDLRITPHKLHIPDTTLLSELLDIDRGQLDALVHKAMQGPRYQESILARYIDPYAHGVMQEKLWDFNGIHFYASSKRQYRFPVGANFLGYISEVSQKDIRVSDGYYQNGDVKGKSGVERSYEELLHGKKGKRVALFDPHGREVGSYYDGKYDQPAIKGVDLMMGIDADLQALGEELMYHKKGSIVAIEPQSGEILAFVSAPTYRPDMLTGKELARNWTRLEQDSMEPLFNRPLMAEYPPGSIFKVAIGLAALNEGVITPQTFYSCGGGFKRNKGKPGCRLHPHPLRLSNAVKYSCNSYFAATYMDFLHHDKYKNIYEGFHTWRSYMDELGIGRKLGVDIPYEKPGLLPDTSMYDNAKRWYGHNRWSATTIISNAIGQGEILMTPLQMAHFAAIIANRGYYFTPHFVKAIKNNEKGGLWEYQKQDRTYTHIDPRHFNVMVDAMGQVVSSGTARRAYIEGIQVCGKTGTVENPHGLDHATFIGFAPKSNPRIAIAVIVENCGGGGGKWAAPMASVLIERYLNGKVEQKNWEYIRLLKADFIHSPTITSR